MTWLWLALMAHAATVDRVAAVVNDEVIALSEVYDLGDSFIRQACPRMRPECITQSEVQVLDTLIQQRLIRQELYRLGMQVTAEEIDRTIDQVGRDNGLTDRAALRRELERAGLAWDVYREQLTDQIRQMKFTEGILRPRISVREDEVQERYRRATRDFQGPPTATVEALALALPEGGGQEAMVETVIRARSIATAVNEGEVEWKDAVAEHDSGLYAPREGLMGTFRQGELMDALDAVVFASELGVVSEPVVVGSAVFLVKVTEKKDSDVLSFEEAAPKLREQIFQEKMERELEEWTASARRRASVRIMLGDGSGSSEFKRVTLEESISESAETPAPAGDGRTGGGASRDETEGTETTAPEATSGDGRTSGGASRDENEDSETSAPPEAGPTDGGASRPSDKEDAEEGASPAAGPE
jgi:parvulin-like peptidyl-prolyl isomerase